MKIAAYNKCSMVDYDGYIVSVVFTKGCNMTCPYCHNVALLDEEGLIDMDEVIQHLKKRKGLLDGVVISGGEPTLQKDLIEFARAIKALGYKVKLDTNGSHPQVIRNLIDEQVVDYIAMDIKTVPEQYPKMCGLKFELVEEALELIRNFGYYELRTTLYPLMSLEMIHTLCRTYGDDPYYLQQYRPNTTDDLKAYPDEVIRMIGQDYGIPIRGID